MVFDGSAAMSADDWEEQTHCGFDSECETIADNRVYNPVFGRFESVCDEHKPKLMEWINDHLFN